MDCKVPEDSIEVMMELINDEHEIKFMFDLFHISYNKKGLASDEIKIIGETTGVYDDVVEEIRLELEPVESVKKGDVFSLKTNDLVRRGDKLYKVIDNKTAENR